MLRKEHNVTTRERNSEEEPFKFHKALCLEVGFPSLPLQNCYVCMDSI